MEKEIRKKLQRYSEIFKTAQEQGKKEADLVTYITEFFQNVLGYDVFTEISKEYQIKDKYCDLAIKINGRVEFLIEIKQPGIRLADRHVEQAANYAMHSGTKWAILTNGCEWRFFHLNFDEETGMDRVLVFKIDLGEDFDKRPDEVISKFLLLHKKQYIKGELDKYWEKRNLLTPPSLLAAVFTENVLRTVSRELRKRAKVRVGIEDIERELKNMLDKEILAELAELKLKRIRRRRRPVQRKQGIKPAEIKAAQLPQGEIAKEKS